MGIRHDQSFGNIGFYQAKKEIKERFSNVLTDLQKTVERNGSAVQAIQRFRNCLNKPGNNDISRLPIYTTMPFSKKRNKIMCALCTISYTIQLYWAFCMFRSNATYQLEKDKLDAHLQGLENIATKGLKAFKIMGNKYPGGYYLEEK